jgi:Domain of unknown function (DUF4396)
MEARAAHAHPHEMPTEGSALTGVAISATLHCLTGCAIGEVAGMAIGTALGFSNLGTIALAVVLAFLFGYTLTSLPLLGAGLALSAVIPIALASDTLSIATMEVVDNVIMVAIPGAMHASLGDVLFWGALAFALAVAFVLTVPVNRWLLARGKGHTAVHETGIHGGPDTRIVGAATIAAAIFGIAVLAAEAVSSDEPSHGGHEVASAASSTDQPAAGGHTEHREQGSVAATSDTEVHGLTVADRGLRLELAQTELEKGRPSELSFQIVGEGGEPLRDFEVEHEKRMHLIVVRRDMVGFQHLHPEMATDGTWSTPIEIPQAGSYRVFADFNHEGVSETLGSDLAVDGRSNYHEIPAPSQTTAADGYRVTLAGSDSKAGVESELAFTVTRGGEPVHVDPYLGADGHLVALREGDLAYLHNHPVGHAEEGASPGHEDAIRFMTSFPTEGRYRLFLQFKHEGRVHTAEITREVTR